VYQYPVSVAVQAKGLKIILTLTEKKMNSKHRKLFVKRNVKTKDKVYCDIEFKYNRSVKTVAAINENILLASMTGKSSYDKLAEKDNAGYFHQELKPILIMLRLLGCFPVRFFKSG